MIKYIYFLLIVAVGLLPFLKRQHSLNVLEVICFALMAFLFAFSTDTPDYEPYHDFYRFATWENIDNINSSIDSPLFSASVLMMKSIGADFNVYRLLMFLLLSFPLWLSLRGIFEFGPFIGGYGLIMFFFDLTQLRFAFAEYVLLLALFYLIKGRKMVFVTLVVVAALFHSMVIPFVLFAFIPSEGKFYDFVSKVIPYIIIGIFVASLVGRTVIETLQQTVAAISYFDEYGRYMEEAEGMRYGYVLFAIYQSAHIWIARYFFRHQSLVGNFSNKIQENFNRINYLIQMVGFLFVIPAMLNVNFSRYIRIMFIINLINICLFIYAAKKRTAFINTKEKNVMLLYFVGVNLMWVLGETMVNGSYSIIIEHMFG